MLFTLVLVFPLTRLFFLLNSNLFSFVKLKLCLQLHFVYHIHQCTVISKKVICKKEPRDPNFASNKEMNGSINSSNVNLGIKR